MHRGAETAGVRAEIAKVLEKISKASETSVAAGLKRHPPKCRTSPPKWRKARETSFAAAESHARNKPVTSVTEASQVSQARTYEGITDVELHKLQASNQRNSTSKLPNGRLLPDFTLPVCVFLWVSDKLRTPPSPWRVDPKLVSPV
jgi:hypothetical protein